MTTKALRVSIGSLALLLGALFAATAQAAPKRIGVPKFDGVQEALVRKKVMQILKSHGFDLAKSREMEIGLANTGALLDNDEGFQKVAKELALAAIVTGEIGKKRAKIAVHDGKDGSLLGEANFAGANPRAIMNEVGRSFWSKLGGEIERGKTPSGSKKPQKVVAEAPEDDEKTPEAGGEAEPPPPEPKSKSKAKEETAAAEGGEGEEAQPKKKKKKKKKVGLESGVVVEEETNEVIPPTLDVQLGPRIINRALAYNEDASNPGLRSYSLPASIAIAGSVVWYPIGPFTDGALKNLGVEAGVEQAFFVSSTLPTGEKFGTSIHEFSGGLRYRVPFGAGHYFYGSGTGGEHAFTFKSSGGSDRGNLDIPDVIYWYMRPGVGIHFEVGAQISLGLSGGFRWVINGAGAQFHDTFFPYSTVNGADAQAIAGYRIALQWEARVVFDFRRYFSSMNCYDPMAANGGNRCIRNITLPSGEMRTVNFTAGGAVDQYFSVSAVIAFTFGGSEFKMPDEAEEAPPPPKRKRKVESEEEEPPLGKEVGGGGGGDE